VKLGRGGEAGERHGCDSKKGGNKRKRKKEAGQLKKGVHHFVGKP